MTEPGERPISEVIKNICTTDSREVKQKGSFVLKIICSVTGLQPWSGEHSRGGRGSPSLVLLRTLEQRQSL